MCKYTIGNNLPRRTHKNDKLVWKCNGLSITKKKQPPDLNPGEGAACAAQSRAAAVDDLILSCSIAPEENFGADPPTGSSRKNCSRNEM